MIELQFSFMSVVLMAFPQPVDFLESPRGLQARNTK